MRCALARLVLVGPLLLAACTDEGGSADAGETAETGSPGDGDGDGDSLLPDPAAGWEQAFVADGVAFECDAAEAELINAGVPAVSVGEATLYVGAEQNNQGERDAIIARFDAGAQTYCVRHETEPPNSAALGLTWDGGATAYLVYAVFSAGNGFEGLGGWVSEYSPGPISGVGAQATVVGTVAAATGELQRASFILAVTADEKVAAHLPSGAPTVLADGSVEQRGTAQDSPIDADGATAMVCEGGPYTTQYVLSADLAQLVCAKVDGCTSTQPCPG